MLIARVTIAVLGMLATVPGAAQAANPAPYSGTVLYAVPEQFPINAESREAVLEQLKAVCRSPHAADRQRCNHAWQLINAAKAQLDARRAAGTTARLNP